MTGDRVARIAPGTRRDLGWVNYGIAKASGVVSRSEPLNIFTTLGRHRGLFRRWLFFASGLMPGGLISRRDTELVILRVAHNTACEYEAAHHRKLGRKAGLSEAEIERVADGPAAGGWTPRQRLLLRAADELHRDGVIGDALWDELRGEFDERHLIELCLLIGHYEMVAMTLKSLGVQLERSH